MKEIPAISHPVTAKAGFRPANLSSPKCRPDRRSGFTLVELLVVITIILVLAALSVMGFKRKTARSPIAIKERQWSHTTTVTPASSPSTT
ncbi:type II secretion system protein [bacterium]|nr:type II secretion system protein [bacterium]